MASAAVSVRDDPLRVSYVLPPLGTIDEHPKHRFFINGDGSAYTLPLLELPKRAERKSLNGAQPRLRRIGGEMPPVAPDAYERAMRPRHLLPVTSLALDTTTPICEPHADQFHTGILYSGGQDGMVCAWDLCLSNGAATMPRQSARAHSHWISEVKLCNSNQTLLSASSDCTIKAWNPHDANSCMSPQLLGTHSDYVKALALAQATDCVVSASLDHSVCLWDLREGRHDPLWRVSTRNSLYAVGASQIGTVIAAAGVDRGISGWDPRVRRKSFELVGHLDNVRALCVSDDGKYVLSGSADSTVRLWSVGEQRCVHTFEHHTSSVWSLCAPNGDFKLFYSGDRDGNLCKVDLTNAQDYSEADCVVLAREYYDDTPSSASARGAAIYSIAALPGDYVWTTNATHSVISRWIDVPAGKIRAATQPQNRISMADIPEPDVPETANDASPLHIHPTRTINGFHGIMRAMMLSDRVHVLSIDTGGIVALWNIVRGVCLGTFDADQVTAAGVAKGLRARENGIRWRPQDTPSDTLEVVQNIIDGQGAAMPWCTLDASNGLITVHISESQALSAEMYADDIFADVFSEAPRVWNETKGMVGVWVLRNIASKFIARERQLRSERNLDGMPLLLYENGHNTLEENVRARINETEADLPMLSPLGGSQAPDTPVRIANPSPLFPGTVTTSALARDATDVLRAFFTPNEPMHAHPQPSPPTKRQFFFGIGRRDREKNDTQQESISAVQKRTAALRDLFQGEICLPPPTNDIPDLHFAYPPTLVISRVPQGSEMLQIMYGGAATHTGTHADIIELMAPIWLLRILLTQPKTPAPPEVRLTVSPWHSDKPEDARLILPQLSPSDRLLMSSRLLRIGRVAMYICEYLSKVGHNLQMIGLQTGARPTPLNSPVEVLCNGMVLSPYSTLAEVQRYAWKNSGDIRLEYRLQSSFY
ncbi:hypothetical protein MCUN1_003683 [Malassezia cuniculi]|uniref:WD repeat-containing protein 48 n=1 Tax=Malassezia cuniculi TaxID=948313 RepID=A0AAF0J810_9BASI|nr:hypothetical protein MCUN1_003683 [Malassezia cuniculi]